MTQASAGALAALPTLQSLTFKDNGPLSAENAATLTGRKWTKLDIGASRKAADAPEKGG